MAMDPTALENQIISVLKEATPNLLPDVLKGVSVQEVPLQDGSSVYETTEERGPAEVGEEGEAAVRPLARAIAQAVVDHIVTHAQIDGSGVGGDWRIT